MRHHASGDFAASRAYLARLKRVARAAKLARCLDTGRFICEDGSHAKVTDGPVSLVALNAGLYP